MLVENIRRHMTMLCEEIGERHLGSEGEQRAARYIEDIFREHGYETVTETYEAPGWQYGDYSLKTVDDGKTTPCFPCFYSNGCDVTGKLLRIRRGDLDKLDELALSGKICFLDISTSVGDVGSRNRIALDLENRGAAALIVISNYSDTVNTKIVREPELKRLAVITVSGDTAFELTCNIEKTFRLKVEARSFMTSSCNVIARHHGSDGTRAVIGAHYDTAPGIAGASDNATGTAVLLEVARLVKDRLGNESVDFVAFSGEEYGGKSGYGLGSLEYAERHHNEPGGIRWMLNIDDVGESIGQNRIYVGRSSEMKEIVRQVLSGFGREVEECYLNGSDSMAFHVQGIPTVLIMNSSPYWQIHSPKDDLCRIDCDNLAQVCTAVESIVEVLLSWREAERPGRLEFVPFEDGDMPEIERIVGEIWSMGVAKQREDLYGTIGGKPWDEWAKANIRDAVGSGESHAYVSRCNGRISGFCTYSIYRSKGIAEIGYNGVAPEYAGRGIGTYQIEQLLSKIQEEGLAIVEVTTGLNEGHLPARRMYEKSGFEEFFRSITYTRRLP